MENSLLQQIKQGCNDLDLSLTDQQQIKLQRYVELLLKWNKVYNLTSVRNVNEMVSRHILDSLAIIPHLKGESLLDVGTGAGLPGIPIAIAFPDMAVTLLDTNSKKTRFLQQAKAELGLNNVTVVHARVEAAELPKFDIITTRAFASVEDIIALTGHHCADEGCLLLMKGVQSDEEIATIGAGFKLDEIVTLSVPECDGQRHLIRLIKE
ncbi:MAG: 16S rRNA (guanine(527)-N(7))-methyltransferase RsmG [Gammaproteobacteria bacterium]|nr:MAG: 16S rRNA (guanine(527)-N(7))-methyltransferase RsmG [Gammaproteobacteria bacterium]